MRRAAPCGSAVWRRRVAAPCGGAVWRRRVAAPTFVVARCSLEPSVSGKRD
jgi:hypothetical protein